MNTFIKVPIDYKNMNWAQINPSLVLKSAKHHYKEARQKIKELENKTISDSEYLEQIDSLSKNVAQFCNLVFFLSKSGKIEYVKIDNEVKQMQLKIHYQLYANKKIYKNFKDIKKNTLNEEDRYFIDVTDKTFIYSGVKFSEKNKQRMIKNDQELTKAQMKFHYNCSRSSENLKIKISNKDYNKYFKKHLHGMKFEQKINYKILEINEPNYIEIMLNCASDKIRKEVSHIYNNVATKGRYNNTPVILNILKLEKLAPKLLGYSNPNDFILNERVLNRHTKVENFLLKLHKKLQPIADQELQILEKRKGSKLEGSDIDYYATQYKQEKYNIDFKEISQFFPFYNVFNKILDLNKHLFGIEFKKCISPNLHPEMLAYDIFDVKTNKKMGLLYIDVAYRKNKESGAWASELLYDKDKQEHVVYLGANFDVKNGKLENLHLDFDEIQTLFHEMGHVLHFVCPQIKYHAYLSEYVEWDFIELPSQLYEKWAENIDILLEMSGTDTKGNKISKETISCLLESNKLFKAMDYQYLIAKSLLDIKLHNAQNIKDIVSFEYNILKKYQPVAPSKNIARLMSFTHLFGGGYDVGFYSYIYANVLDSNVWNLFLNEGIMNTKQSMKFRDQVLNVGASQPAQTQIKNLLGSVSIQPFIQSFKTDY